MCLWPRAGPSRLDVKTWPLLGSVRLDAFSACVFSVFLMLNLHSLPIGQPTWEAQVRLDGQHCFAWQKRKNEHRLRTPDVALHAKPREGKVTQRRRSRSLVLRLIRIFGRVADGAKLAGVPCAPLTDRQDQRLYTGCGPVGMGRWYCGVDHVRNEWSQEALWTFAALLTKENSGTSRGPQNPSPSFQDRPHSRALFLGSSPRL
jgi:hypothetical protein